MTNQLSSHTSLIKEIVDIISLNDLDRAELASKLEVYFSTVLTNQLNQLSWARPVLQGADASEIWQLLGDVAASRKEREMLLSCIQQSLEKTTLLLVDTISHQAEHETISAVQELLRSHVRKLYAG